MDKYIDEVSNILMYFQYIEAAIRGYIVAVNKKIQEKLEGTIPFKYDNNWIKKDSLGTLIEKFEKINENQDLIKELKGVTPVRNEIAHKAFLLTTEQEKDALYKAFAIRDLQKLGKQLHELLFKIVDEIKRMS